MFFTTVIEKIPKYPTATDVSIDYEGQLIYIKYILTHAEYDKDNWKNDPYF